MGTHWQTEPIMERSLSERSRSRPQVYVHVEFGVSWAPREPIRSHAMTYRSRTFRDRFLGFPRRVPAPSTNYLNNATQEHQTYFPHRHQYALHGLQEALPPALGPSAARDPFVLGVVQEEDEARRSSRSDSRSSHGRGRSAPPPLNNNPWDVYEPAAAANAGPSTIEPSQARTPGEPEMWKDLPEVPSRYRLGEDGLPWSPSAYPMGHEPVANPQDSDRGSSVHTRHSHQEETAASQSGNDIPQQTQGGQSEASEQPQSPATGSIRSLEYHPPPHNIEHRNVRELEALSAAMVTVDNGFENQWWNQGARANLPAEEVLATVTPPATRFSVRSVGWAVASGPPRAPSQARDDQWILATANNTMVSPVTSHQSPPPRSYLARSMSTRSEELYVVDDRSYQPTSPSDHWSAGYYA